MFKIKHLIKINMDHEMKGAVTNIIPSIEKLCGVQPAHVSHQNVTGLKYETIFFVKFVGILLFKQY